MNEFAVWQAFRLWWKDVHVKVNTGAAKNREKLTTDGEADLLTLHANEGVDLSLATAPQERSNGVFISLNESGDRRYPIRQGLALAVKIGAPIVGRRNCAATRGASSAPLDGERIGPSAQKFGYLLGRVRPMRDAQRHANVTLAMIIRSHSHFQCSLQILIYIAGALALTRTIIVNKYSHQGQCRPSRLHREESHF
jgi:hypothetical protein